MILNKILKYSIAIALFSLIFIQLSCFDKKLKENSKMFYDDGQIICENNRKIKIIKSLDGFHHKLNLGEYCDY